MGFSLSPKLPHFSSICRCQLGRKSKRSSLYIRLCCLLRLNPNYLGLKETKHCLSLVYQSRISKLCFYYCRGLLDSHDPQRFGDFSSRSSTIMVRQPFCLSSRLKSSVSCPNQAHRGWLPFYLWESCSTWHRCKICLHHWSTCWYTH